MGEKLKVVILISVTGILVTFFVTELFFLEYQYDKYLFHHI